MMVWVRELGVREEVATAVHPGPTLPLEGEGRSGRASSTRPLLGRGGLRCGLARRGGFAGSRGLFRGLLCRSALASAARLAGRIDRLLERRHQVDDVGAAARRGLLV